MDFEWSPAQVERYQQIMRSARAQAVPATEHYVRDEWRWCGQLGLFGLSVPRRYGGLGLDALSTVYAVEAFGHGYRDMGLAFGTSAHLFACAMPIAEYGTEELKARVLPRMCSGELVAGNTITEDGAGSDVTALATKAVRTPEGYRLSGEKSFVSNGPVADVVVVYAVTDASLGFLGVSAFVVERDRPGVEASGPFAKLSRRCSRSPCGGSARACSPRTSGSWTGWSRRAAEHSLLGHL